MWFREGTLRFAHPTLPSLTQLSHTLHMACHMKTTLNIDDSVMRRLKREAARQGRTMSEMVETALRLLLQLQRHVAELPPLPISSACSWISRSARQRFVEMISRIVRQNEARDQATEGR